MFKVPFILFGISFFFCFALFSVVKPVIYVCGKSFISSKRFDIESVCTSIHKSTHLWLVDRFKAIENLCVFLEEFLFVDYHEILQVTTSIEVYDQE